MNGRDDCGEIDGSYERVNVINLFSDYSKFCGWRQSYEDLKARSYVHTFYDPSYPIHPSIFPIPATKFLDLGLSTLDVRPVLALTIICNKRKRLLVLMLDTVFMQRLDIKYVNSLFKQY